MVDEMGWWAVPIVTLVIFTLYGIEGIGSQLEDPFSRGKIDIKTDALVKGYSVGDLGFAGGVEEDGAEGGRDVYGEGRSGLSKLVGGSVCFGVASFVRVAVIGNTCMVQIVSRYEKLCEHRPFPIHVNLKLVF